MPVTTPVQPKPRLGPPYWRLWWANAVDNAGDGAFASALPLLAVTLTRNPELISAVSVATYLPWLVVSLRVTGLMAGSDNQGKVATDDGDSENEPPNDRPKKPPQN